MQELKHWGIPKMRWGFRRFQNYDGSLTAEGRERYNRSRRKGRDISGRPKLTTSAKKNQKKLSVISDDEIRNLTDRLVLENRYLEAVRNRKQLDSTFSLPKKNFLGSAAKAGKDVTGVIFRDIFLPLYKEVGIEGIKGLVKDMEKMTVDSMKPEKEKKGLSKEEVVALIKKELDG